METSGVVMSPSPEGRAKVRLSLDVSPELNQRLEEMATATGSNKSDVLRKAIALMSVAVDARRNGEHILVSPQVPAGTAREIIGILE